MTWEWTVHVKWEGLFHHHITTIHFRVFVLFFTVQLFFLNLIRALFECWVALWACLNFICWEGTHYLVVLSHILKGMDGLLWFHWKCIHINIILNDTIKDILFISAMRLVSRRLFLINIWANNKMHWSLLENRLFVFHGKLQVFDLIYQVIDEDHCVCCRNWYTNLLVAIVKRVRVFNVDQNRWALKLNLTLRLCQQSLN